MICMTYGAAVHYTIGRARLVLIGCLRNAAACTQGVTSNVLVPDANSPRTELKGRQTLDRNRARAGRLCGQTTPVHLVTPEDAATAGATVKRTVVAARHGSGWNSNRWGRGQIAFSRLPA